MRNFFLISSGEFNLDFGNENRLVGIQVLSQFLQVEYDRFADVPQGFFVGIPLRNADYGDTNPYFGPWSRIPKRKELLVPTGFEPVSPG
jgi:hypothetical protein